MILARRYGSWFSTKSGFSDPSGRNRTSWNSHFERPVRLIVFRKTAGKILSVSMFGIGIGAAIPVNCVNFSIPSLFLGESQFIHDAAIRPRWRLWRHSLVRANSSMTQQYAQDGDCGGGIHSNCPEQHAEFA